MPSWLAFLVTIGAILLFILWFVLFWPGEPDDVDDEPDYAVTDCDRRGHVYRQQISPRVYRCVNCGDVRVHDH